MNTAQTTPASNTGTPTRTLPMPSAVFRRWLLPYFGSTAISFAIGSPLVWFGIDMPLDKPGALAAILLGTCIAYFVMLAVDVGVTILYLLTGSGKYGDQRLVSADRLRQFPLISAARSLTLHWLAFAVPLIAMWVWLFGALNVEVKPIEVSFFIVVSLLISYIHAILEYHLLNRALDRLLGEAIVPRSDQNWLPIAIKITGISLFVGAVPVALLAETIYLKLTRVGAPGGSFAAEADRVIVWAVAYTLVSIAVSALLSWLLASDINRGSRRLIEGFRRLTRGEYHHRVRISTTDEFEELAAGFNSMASELEQKETMYEEFGRLVDPTIRDEVLAGRVKQEGEARHAVILFTDLVNFTPFSQRVSPQELIEYLNDLFTDIVVVISKHGGTVNKFVGDAILAFWNVPVTHRQPEMAAFRCSIELLKVVEEFNRKRADWRKKFIPELSPTKIGIGIHAGQVIAGTVGAAHRKEYTIIGANVNFASRLQSFTRKTPCDILFSSEIAELVKQSDEIRSGSYQLKSYGSIELKGVADPKPIFGITGK